MPIRPLVMVTHIAAHGYKKRGARGNKRRGPKDEGEKLEQAEGSRRVRQNVDKTGRRGGQRE